MFYIAKKNFEKYKHESHIIRLLTRKKPSYYRITKKKKKKYERQIEPIQFHIFEVAESESEVRIEPLGRNFFLTSKICFAAFIFFQAQFCSKNSEKIHRSVFYYHK